MSPCGTMSVLYHRSQSLNRRELEVKQRYEADGWKVLRNGAPDFVCLKLDAEGNISEMMAVEVKPVNGRLTYEQSVYRKVFEKAGVIYKVEGVP